MLLRRILPSSSITERLRRTFSAKSDLAAGKLEPHFDYKAIALNVATHEENIRRRKADGDPGFVARLYGEHCQLKVRIVLSMLLTSRQHQADTIRQARNDIARQLQARSLPEADKKRLAEQGKLLKTQGSDLDGQAEQLRKRMLRYWHTLVPRDSQIHRQRGIAPSESHGPSGSRWIGRECTRPAHFRPAALVFLHPSVAS